MEWRCEWCGKPHAEDDPPCDNCGHGTFERAVVQQPAESEALESTTVWVCTECRREHTKHAPPCSRCGNATLERREQTVDDSELVAPGYLDLLTPRYVLGFLAVLGLAGVLLLGFAGVIDLPGMGGPDVPDVEDVPGSAESVDGRSLAAVEEAYVERFNDARREASAVPFDRDGHVDAVAEYVNQRVVKATLGSGSAPDAERVQDLLGDSCRAGRLRFVDVDAPDPGASAEDVGRAVAEARIETHGVTDPAREGTTGVDIHAGPDGTLYALQITC